MTNPITPQDLWAIARVGGASVAANGRGVFPVTTFDMESDEILTRLYSLPDLRTLTSATSVTAPVVSADGTQVAFLRKVDDIAQVHVMLLDGGEAEKISAFTLGVQGMKWLPDGTGLVVAASVFGPDPDRTAEVKQERADSKVSAKTTEHRFYRFWDTWMTDGYVTHLFLLKLDGQCTDLTPNLNALVVLPTAAGNDQFDVSHDGTKVILSAADLDYGDLLRPRFELREVAIDGTGMRRLTPNNPGDDAHPVCLPDGRVAFGAEAELDYYATPVLLTLLELDGSQTRLADGWNLSPSSWIPAPDSDALIAIAEERVRTKAYRVPLDGSPPTTMIDDRSVSSPAGSSDTLYLIHQSVSHPPTLVAAEWTGGPITKVSTLNDDLLDGLSLGEVEDTRFTGATGADVQMLVLYPPDFDASKNWPLVHMIHGGPHGSFGDVWHHRWNAHAFAAPGYVVAMVNFHGSTSFGHEFTGSISGEWGDKPAADILAATDALVARGFIDTDRMALTGGSYGGYLTAWIATQDSRFSCAIAHAAVVNLGAMYATDWTTGLGRSSGARAWEDPIRNGRWSPSFHYAGYETPTLVIQGEQDFRVPVDQGLELYGILKSKGVEARLVYYPNENHWILKPNNSLHWYGEVHAWLARYLG